MFSKIVAVLCIVALLVGSFQMTAFKSEAATEAKSTGGYDLVTLSELTDNYTPGTVTAKTTYTKQSALTWAGTVFEGEFSFSDISGKQNGMLLLGNTANSRGLKVYLQNETTLRVRFQDKPGTSGRTKDVDITAGNVGVERFANEKIKLKINFDFANYATDGTTADVTAKITVNDKYTTTLMQTSFQLEYMSRVVWLAATADYPLYHNSQYENAYDIVTFSDLVASTEEEKGTLSSKKVFTKYEDLDLNNTVFEGKLTFAGGTADQNSMLVLGHTSKGGLRIWVNTSDQLQIRLHDYNTTDAKSRTVDKKINASALELNTWAGREIKLKVWIDFSNTDLSANTSDVTVTVQIEDKYKISLSQTDFQLAYMRRVVWLNVASGCSLSYDTVANQSPTLTDFGFDEITTAESGIMKYKDDKSTYDHVTVEGNYVFSKEKEANYVIFGKQWYGVRFGQDGSGNLVISHAGLDANSKAVTKQMGVIYAEDLGFDLADTAIKMKAIFTFENVSADGTIADVVVGVVINNSYRRAFRAEEIAVDTMPLGLFVYADGSTNPLTVSVNEILPSYLIEVSPADFGIADKRYKAEDQTSLTAMGVKGELSNQYKDATTNMTLDGKVFSANVKFVGENSQLSIGGVKVGSWHGFSVTRTSTGFAFASNSASWCGMDALAIDPLKAGLSSADDAFNLKISCEFEDVNGDGTDDCIKFGIWFNDKLYDNAYVYTKSIPTDIGCGAFICCKSEGGFIDIATEEKIRDDITPYILEDFEVETKMYTEQKHYTKNIAKYSANSVKGKMTLAGTAWSSIYALETSVGRGFRFSNSGDNLKYSFYINNGTQTKEYMPTIVSDVSAGESFNFEVSKEVLDLDMGGAANDIRIGVWINGELHNKQYYYLLDCADKFGQTVNLAATSETNSITVQDSLAIDSYNLANGEGYLVSGKGDLSINGTSCTNGKLISVPGDYIVRSADKGTYVKYVACYYPGDAKVDGELDICDLVATKKASLNVKLSTKAAKAAADNNRDGKVDGNDCADLRTKLLTSVNIKTAKDTFLSYEDGVMPIAGFYGPYRYTDKHGETYDWITDNVYQKLAGAKINLINYYAADYRDSADDVLDNLALAEKYNMGVYVTDSRINGDMTVANLAKRLAGYMQYRSFKGISIVDEPNTDTYNNAKDGETVTNKLASYVPQATLLNRFNNTLGYMNLLPLRDGLNKSGGTLESAYQTYIDEYLTTNGKLLSWDYYVWDHNTIPSAYFTNLSMMRNNAIEKQIPFWSYIQAGSNWNDERVDLDATNNTVPSKAQLLWNVNTSLAYGAKGIQYFPLVQPAYFAYENSDDKYDYDRNGLIGADGNTNDWYDYVAEANTQIEAVDEYLMYASSEAVLAVGEAAQTDTGITTSTYNNVIQSISADNGAVVGVFQYGKQKLLYVVNYDTSTMDDDTIRLTFEDKMSYKVVSKQQNEASSVSEGASQTLSLSLVNGGAALVVLN